MIHVYKSPVDILNSANKGLFSVDPKVNEDSAEMVLKSASTLEYVGEIRRHTALNASNPEIQIIARAIDIQNRVTVEKYQEKKRPLFFLDLFNELKLVRPTEISSTIRATKIQDDRYSDVQFISDMTDDLPTQAGNSEAITGVRIEPIGNSVRIGLFEMRDAIRNGEDLMARRVTQQLESIRAFIDAMIANGAPLKDMYGLLNNPALLGNTYTVAPSEVNPPFTEWFEKSPTEIISDLANIKSLSFSTSGEIAYPNQFIVAKNAYDVATLTLMSGFNGDSVLTAWNRREKEDKTSTPMMVWPSIAFNGAATDGVSNMGLAGDFNTDTIEMFLANPEILPTQNHGIHFHVPIVSALSGVHIKQPKYLTKWEGM